MRVGVGDVGEKERRYDALTWRSLTHDPVTSRVLSHGHGLALGPARCLRLGLGCRVQGLGFGV